MNDPFFIQNNPNMRPDVFGVGKTLSSALNTYSTVSRQTGRTSHMVSNLRSGDVVISSTYQHQAHLEKMCHNMGITGITFIVIKPNELHDSRSIEKLRGSEFTRAFFEHDFIERYYSHVLASAEQSLNTLVAIATKKAH